MDQAPLRWLQEAAAQRHPAVIQQPLLTALQPMAAAPASSLLARQTKVLCKSIVPGQHSPSSVCHHIISKLYV